MAAELFFLPFNPVFGISGLPAGAATITFWYTQTTTLAPVYADAGLSQRITNPVETDGLGRMPTLYLDGTITYRIQVADFLGAPIGPAIDPYVPGTIVPGLKGDPGGNVMSVGAFSQIAGIPALSLNGTDRIATSSWGTGSLFPKGWGAATYARWSAPMANLPADGQNIWWSYDASGTQAWYLNPEGPAYLDMFGAPRAQPTDNANCYPAWLAANSYSLWAGTGVYSFYYYGGAPIMVRPGYYYFGANTLQFKRVVFTLQGCGFGMAGGNPVIFEHDADTTAVIFARYNTDGKNIASTPTTGGDGSQVRGIEFVCRGYVRGNYQNPAILARSRGLVEDCTISGFSGAGIRVYASSGAGGAGEGNANGFVANRVRILNCGDGISTQGADANACTFECIDIATCFRWGINEQSFLGNTYIGCQVDACGQRGSGGRDTVLATTYNNGFFWAIRADPQGQADGTNAGLASTTAPGTNSNVWIVWRAAPGGPDYYNQQWVSGATFAEGGAIRTQGLNAPSIFAGQYTEGGMAPVQGQGLAIFDGGLLGSGQSDETNSTSGGVNRNFSSGVRSAQSNLQTGDLMEAILGGEPSLGTLLRLMHTTYAPNAWRFGLGYGAQLGPDLAFTYANSATPFRITGPGTQVNFGRNAPQPYVFEPLSLAFGGAMWQHGAGPPTAGYHAVGETSIEDVPVPGGYSGYRCTAAGTPGTWKGFGLIAN